VNQGGAGFFDWHLQKRQGVIRVIMWLRPLAVFFNWLHSLKCPANAGQRETEQFNLSSS